jgi:hypothetical protein
MIEMDINVNGKSKNCNPHVFAIKFGAGAASRYGSGSTKMMQLLAAPAPALQRCLGF